MNKKTDYPHNFMSSMIGFICTIIIAVILISFLYYLFDVASFSASVKNTVEISCQSIISMFENSSSETEKLTIEELRSATNYIVEAGEYFSVVSNNNLISVIYAFATTVILSVGAFVLAKISKKGEEVNGKLRKFNETSDNLNRDIKESEKRIDNIKDEYSKLLDLQNITSYILYANLMINECERNLENNIDNFKLLNDIVNKLKMIPNEYREIYSDKMEDKFGGDLGCQNLGKTLQLNFIEFKDKYKGLIKRYTDCGKKDHTKGQYNCIDDIIEDILAKQNDGFYKI